MTQHALSEPASASAASPGVPGLRAFRSPLFRTSLAVVLLLIGFVLIGSLLLKQADDSEGQFGIDFGAYYSAAERSVEGLPIYPDAFLEGPISAQGVDQYLYPPLLAQAIRPVTLLSQTSAAWLWLALQAAAIFAAMWLGTGIGGARASLERALWCGVAVLYFLPAFDALWKGNVSGFLALTSVMVALGGTAAGVGASVGALLKAVPGTLLPAALVSDRRSRWTAVLTLLIAGGISFVLAPGAWMDYPTVVLNMMAGPADYANNLAPAAIADQFGLADPVVVLVRLASLGLVVASLVGSVLLARSREGLPAAALLGVVALLLFPGSLWFHYYVVLLPFAAIAWPRASTRVRLILFLAAALITLSLVWLPLSTIAGAVLAATTLVTIWPKRAASVISDPPAEAIA